MVQALIFAFEIYLAIMIIYAIYKVIWYTVKMLSFKHKINKINTDTVSARFHRDFLHIIFGKKGYVDFVVTTKNEKYAVSVISFISTHSRWNIEKTRSTYYVEARRRNSIFYRLDNNSHSPEHAKQYRRESRFARCELHLQPKNEEFDKQILLIYPKPKELTYTDVRFDYLSTGSKVGDHEIMHADDFFELFKNK